MTAAPVGRPRHAEASAGAFDPARPYRLSSSVSVRPESFGALVYDFHTRRLSFLKTQPLVRVVEALAQHDDVHGALDEAGVDRGGARPVPAGPRGPRQAGTIKPR